jgi:hypothetical protein
MTTKNYVQILEVISNDGVTVIRQNFTGARFTGLPEYGSEIGSLSLQSASSALETFGVTAEAVAVPSLREQIAAKGYTVSPERLEEWEIAADTHNRILQEHADELAEGEEPRA